MNNPVTSFRLSLSIFAFGCVALTSVSAADGEAVTSSAKRQEALAQAKALLSEKTSVSSGKNPFSPEGFGENAAAPNQNQGAVANTPAPGPRSGRDLLEAIAAGLKPNLMVVSGQPVLVFGQKRVKAGGSVTITFEGKE